uniref:Uncharacterized protein n=1 Tax=Eutreptiella gymnastica TaxID=73025 RepID=A0A7S1I1V3_9EUGL|mmetsp:Transcript_122603/g.212581  ORF Transcript_122603/g.212581 Transcript_122603/m.212581 type:complete len:145 (+) Transcript_122603:2-436(+)
MYWDMLQTPPWPDYNTHNWVVSRASRIQRIDFDMRSLKKHPMGRPYIQRIRSFLCLPPALTKEEHLCRECAACKNSGTFAFRAHPPKTCRSCYLCLLQAHQEAYEHNAMAVNGTFESCIGHRPPNPNHLFEVTIEMCSVGQRKP